MLDTTRWRGFAIAILGLLLCMLTNPLAAAAEWHGTRQLRARLRSPVTLLWQGQRLRKTLDALEANYRITIWLDRRLDPQQTFDLEINDQPLREVIQGIAEQCNAGYQIYGNFVYLGPQQATRELATLMALAREQLRRCPARVQRQWLDRYELEWASPREPASLLAQLAAQCQADFVGEDLIPHDLWRAGKAPDLHAYELATLWLLSFDRQARFDPTTGNLVAKKLQSPVTLERNYASSKKLQVFLRTNPPIAAQRSGNQLSVSGSVQYHEELAAHLQGKSASQTEPTRNEKKPTKEPKQLVFTLKIENQPVGAVTDQLAKQLKLDLTWTPETKSLRNRLVSCQVRDATLEELLGAVLAPADLQASKEENGYRIIRQ